MKMEAGCTGTSVRGLTRRKALKLLTSGAGARATTKDEFEKILNLISKERLRKYLSDLVLNNERSSPLCILLEYCEVDTMNPRKKTIAHVILGLSNDVKLIAKLGRVISGLREELNRRKNN